MKELWLLRHAKSSWDSGAVTDFERPLNKRGRSDAPALGDWLRTRRVVPDAVFSSDAQRARETAERVIGAWDPQGLEVRFDHRLYLASCGDLLAFIQALPSALARPLLIGHNPGLDDLVGLLCGPELPYTEKGKLMTTCGLARIRIEGHWGHLGPAGGVLQELVRPADLRRG